MSDKVENWYLKTLFKETLVCSNWSEEENDNDMCTRTVHGCYVGLDKNRLAWIIRLLLHWWTMF